MIMKSIFKASHLAALVIACVFLTASAQAQSWITNGLVAYYPFNGNANDESGNGNDGNATALAFSGDRFGESSKAGEFNGTSAYVEIPSLTTFQYLPLTYSVWIKTREYLPPVSYINQSRIIMGRVQACDGSCGALSLYSEPRYGINDILGYYTGAEFLSSQIRPNLSSWMQLVLTIDINNRGAFYLNGNLVSSQQLGQLSTSFYPIRIGHGKPSVCSPSPDDFWKGGLDDVRIYNRALSSNEVAQLYAIESVNSNTSSDIYVLAIKAATQIQQASTTNLDGLITTPVPLKSTVTTATILSSLAQDEHAAGNYPSSTFPAGALLVVRGDSVIVTDSATNELVDVSDILTAQSDDNSVFSGKQNNATGLAAPMLSEIQYQKLVYDDSAITNGAHLSFTLGGLATVVTKDTVNAIAGTYSETVTSTVKSGAGTGNYQGTPFILSGSFTATCKKTASVP